MARRAATSVLSAEQRDRAKHVGADRYLRTARYRALREQHIFAMPDIAVERCDKLKFPDSYDGRVLGSFASVMLRNDRRVIGFLRARNVRALDSTEAATELWELMGLLVAEHYLKARRDSIPSETRLTPANVLLSRSRGSI